MVIRASWKNQAPKISGAPMKKVYRRRKKEEKEKEKENELPATAEEREEPRKPKKAPPTPAPERRAVGDFLSVSI